MPALLKTVLGLSLFGVPAIASRSHFDLSARTRAALARRANASANTSVGAHAGNSELDSALVRKGDEDESESTPCVCFLEEVETEHDFWGEHKLKFTDLDKEAGFSTLGECTRMCPQECHNKLKYKFDPHEAEEVGAEHVEVPMTASKCSDEGKCKCLDATTTTKRVEEYKRWESQRLDIATTKEVYSSPEQCLEHCECRDRKIRGYWSEHEFDYEGLCVDEWHWGWYLYRNQFCPYLSQNVGLINCLYTQQFKLKEDRSDGGHAYKVELDQLEDGEGHEIEEKIKLKVVKFEAETSTFYRTSEVKVGIKGMKTNWRIYKTSIMGQRWRWTVEDGNGQVQFTINQQRWAAIYGAVWKAYVGTKDDGNHAYYAYGDDEAYNNEEGFKFKFYRDIDKTQYAGKLEHKGNKDDDDEDKYKVKVMPGEDAGLILLTCVLIDKAYDKAK